MLRSGISCRLRYIHIRQKKLPFINSKCNQSTHSRGSKGVRGSVAMIAAASVTTLGVGVIGYSAWSNENRKLIEENVPGCTSILETILGPIIDVLPQRPSISVQINVPKKIEKDPPKKMPIIEKDQEPKGAEKKTVEQKPIPVQPVPLPPVPELDKSTDIDARLATSEKIEIEENENLTKELDKYIQTSQILIDSALSSAEDAARVIHQHAERAYAAIDSGEGHENLFKIAAEVATLKKDLVKTAEEKLEAAKNKIKELQSKIESAKDSKSTMRNKSIFSAETQLSELKFAVSKINSTLAESIRDSAAINEFKELVEAGRKQFEAEVRSLLPDVKLGEKSEKLTTDELNLLLAHAHRKVLALQRSLAKQQTVDKERFKDSVLRQREQETRLLDGKLHSELERQRRDLNLEHRHRLAQVREDLESELRMQLKRQAAAHSDHLSDVLLVQERELERKWSVKLHEELQKETNRYLRELSKINGDLNGLKSALKSRADIDKAAYAAHELWAACESLRTALRLGKAEAHSWEEQLLPLKDKVESIKKAAGKKDSFVETVLNSIPEEALNRGVYTEDALRERFLKVDRICRRVALIGDNGGSLLKYLLSYVQSFFLLNAFEQIPGNEVRNEKFNVNELNAHDILARARYCIAKDDLLQAVRYLNLLKGEPRHVSKDWIKEAILALEAKQAANALMAHAAAQGVKAL